MSEEKDTTEPVNPIDLLVQTTLAGSLASLCPNRSADSKHPEVAQYMEMMRGANRFFHNIEYVAQCLVLLRGIPNFLLKDLPHMIAALLFHKAYYDPRNIRLSIRQSCEIATQYYPGEKTVALFSLIKATRFGTLMRHRYHDDRAYIADISIYMYGLPWEDFRRIWAQTLKEFESSNYKPVRFKKLTAKQLRKMLECSESFGIYQTCHFREKFELQAVANIKQLLEEISV